MINKIIYIAIIALFAYVAWRSFELNKKLEKYMQERRMTIQVQELYYHNKYCGDNYSTYFCKNDALKVQEGEIRAWIYANNNEIK